MEHDLESVGDLYWSILQENRLDWWYESRFILQVVGTLDSPMRPEERICSNSVASCRRNLHLSLSELQYKYYRMKKYSEYTPL